MTWHAMTWYDMARHSTARHDTTALHCNALHCTVRHYTTHHDMARHSTARHDTTALHCTHCTVRHYTTRHETKRHNTTQDKITFIDTQVQALQYILQYINIVEVSIMCQWGLSQSWLYTLYDTVPICDGELNTTRIETKNMKHKPKYDKWNLLNWKRELTHDEVN